MLCDNHQWMHNPTCVGIADIHEFGNPIHLRLVLHFAHPVSIVKQLKMQLHE